MPPFTTILEFKQIFGPHYTSDRIQTDLLVCSRYEKAHFIHSGFDIVHTEQSTEISCL